MAEYSQGTIRKRRKSKGSNEWVWEGVVHKTADGKTRQLSHVLGIPCDPPSKGETKRGRSSVPAGRGARQAMRLLAEWRSTLIDRDAAEQVKDGGGQASDEKVIDFLDRYWETRGFSAVTKDGYDNLRKHIDSPVLDIPIVELTPAIVQRWIDVRRRAGDSDNILNKSLNQLKYACRWGVRMQELSSNPCDPVTPPKRSHRDPNPLSEGDVKRLRTMLEAHRKRGATQSALADAALLALLTGMRIGELCGLAWDDIDGGAEGRMKPDGFIHVNNVVTAPKGGMVLKPSPKNGTRRDVPMNEEIVRALSRRRADIASVEGEDLSGCYVLAKPDGAARFASPDYLGKRWSAFVETTDMKGAEGLMPHFHDLRHTFATQALTHGIDVATVASILGHKNPATTLKYYARWMPNTNAKAMRRMGDMMSGKEASEDERLAELVRSASGNLASLDAEQKKALLSILGSIE